MAPTLESLQPYVEQLFDDSDVQKHLARASANLRGARSRAGSAKSKKKALKDPRLRQRLLDSAQAAVAAGVAIKQGPYVATNDDARDRVLGLVGAGGTEAAGA